jgi:hypothetical protein
MTRADTQLDVLDRTCWLAGCISLRAEIDDGRCCCLLEGGRGQILARTFEWAETTAEMEKRERERKKKERKEGRRRKKQGTDAATEITVEKHAFNNANILLLFVLGYTCLSCVVRKNESSSIMHWYAVHAKETRK